VSDAMLAVMLGTVNCSPGGGSYLLVAELQCVKTDSASGILNDTASGDRLHLTSLEI
jgi:hypothetical protein